MSARRKPDAAWSARYSAKTRRPGGTFEAHPAGTGGSDDEFRGGLWGADRIRFAWRYDGRSATATFKLPADIDDAVAFRRTLTIAIADDWAADDRGHPIRPGSEPADEPEPDNTVVEFVPRPSGATPTPAGGSGGSVTALPLTPPPEPDADAGLFAPIAHGQWDDLADTVTPLEDFASLCDWRMGDQLTTTSKRGRHRAGSTLANVEGELATAAGFFQYLPGDPRLGDPAISAHTSIRFDDLSVGLSESDCLAFVEHRRHLNLTTRSANYQAERAWVRQIEAVERASAGFGTTIELPVAPTPTVEVASPRTVEAACCTVRSALAEAQGEGRIASNPWTPRVDKRIEKAPPTHFSEKQVYSPEQVGTIAEALEAMERSGRDRKGQQAVLTGGRYRGMVETAYAAYLRPEETRASRLSWLHLDGPNPGILVDCAEVNYPLRFTDAPTTRTVVTLKQRNAGDTRWVPIAIADAQAIRCHVQRFVPAPDLTSDDIDAQDPRLFTTHTGAPVDLGTFAEKWLKPVLAKVFPAPGQADLRNLSFRHLRHSGITRELQAGKHIEDVATWAGNSPLVIKTSYRGVIDRLGPNSGPRHPQGAALADAIQELARELIGLSADEADARLEALHPDLTPDIALVAGRALARSAKKRLEAEEI